MKNRLAGHRALAPMFLFALPMTASAQGVVNGGFAIAQLPEHSPWVQFYASGVLDPAGDPGVKMEHGRLFMSPRLKRGDAGVCPQFADIGVFQHGIVPLHDSPCAERIELEFDMKIELALPYVCGDPNNSFGVRSRHDLPALNARLLRGSEGAPPAQYWQMGQNLIISTSDAGNGWLHYRATWERGSQRTSDRYMITFQLGDLGASFDDDESREDYVYLRANQAILEIDNVQLTARTARSTPCTLVSPSPSLDMITLDQGSLGRAVDGGEFTAAGPAAPCDEAGPGQACPQDVNADQVIDGADLGAILSAWGGTDCDADVNADGVVDGADLGAILSAWGACSGG
jgi:hypothetical protein